jgi:DNA modification methylase
VSRTTTATYSDGQVTVHLGDVRSVLASMPDDSIDCCVTSPPYWGLRDYGLASQVWGGADDCRHDWGELERGKRKDILPADQTRLVSRTSSTGRQDGAATNGGRFCRRCGAWLGSLGLEPTVDLFLAHMTEVFAEVRRVLKPSGTLWLNLGDCYNAGTSAARQPSKGRHGYWEAGGSMGDLRVQVPGLKVKDLVGMPWRVAFALQADGWYLRADVIWAKPNPLPESVADRPTRSHEYLFLLTKSPRYFYDREAVKEPCVSGPSDVRKMTEGLPRIGGKHKDLQDPFSKVSAATNIGRLRSVGDPGGRNRRSVWTIATQAYRGAHFATFPERLVEPCIQAGSSASGCCASCGLPFVRVVGVAYDNPGGRTTNGPRSVQRRRETAGFALRLLRRTETMGWRPQCGCGTTSVPAVVLDPFAGSGTTLSVARRLGRRAVGIELNPDYIDLIRARLAKAAPESEAV